MVDASRVEFHKLTSVEVLRQVRAASADVEPPPTDLTIDTDASDGITSAEMIIQYFELRAQRYPHTG